MGTKASSPLWRNVLTLSGAILSVVSTLFILSFLFFDILSDQPSPYLGLFTYLIFPVALAVGVLLIGSGLGLARRRYLRRRGANTRAHYYPRINLNLPQHRRALMTVAAVVLASIPLIGVLSYRGYHYTDSNEFCGTVCHEVMTPQYTSYLQSPHSRVNCAECHIGPGASWYVQSKLSGLRQVLAVWNNSFPRPLPAAIQELRPATETCEQCHWPAKFFGDQLVTIQYFASDEANTHQQLRMLLKTGGSDQSTGPPSGIHWHMRLGFTVEYVALDDQLQDIPWVRTLDHATNEERIYRSDGKPQSDPPPEGTRRVVDCIDCHNRPTHVFRSPQRAVNVALSVDPTLQSLPYSKREAVRALATPYLNQADGLTGVPADVERFYQEEVPEVWQARRRDVERLADAAAEIYRANFFPEMNVNWRSYPDNIGHKAFPGCFRCHDGRLVDAAGDAISHECGACHTFLTPPDLADHASVVQQAGFVHPVPLEGIHGTLRCDNCHSGGVAPLPTCEGCHTVQDQFRAGTLSKFSSISISPDSMYGTVSCDACHFLSEPCDIETIDAVCMDCHEDEGEVYEGLLASWSREVDQLLRDAEGRTDERGRQLLDLLRQAGPLHNIEATRIVTQSVVAESVSP